MRSDMEVCVFGAGSIGCYFGGRLAATGTRVTLIGRPKMVEEVSANGLHITDLHGGHYDVDPAEIRFATSPDRAKNADLILVTVKASATEEVARTLAPLVRPGTVVIILQNGVNFSDGVREALPMCTVLPGVVMFNVIRQGEGRFHQGSDGEIDVESSPALDAFSDAFRSAGLPLLRRPDLVPVQWGKLVLNLNNAINALSGVPLQEELSQRGYRLCLSLAQREALDLLRAAGIRPASMTRLSPAVVARGLQMPNFVFRLAAKRVLDIDPLARSSMWEDFESGRKTEIDRLCGEVVRLGERIGRPAPINARLVELVDVAESGGRRQWSAIELLRTLRAAAKDARD